VLAPRVEKMGRTEISRKFGSTPDSPKFENKYPVNLKKRVCNKIGQKQTQQARFTHLLLCPRFVASGREAAGESRQTGRPSWYLCLQQRKH